MPDYYFHYTSRSAAQAIGSSGILEAGVSGRIYLSPDAYGAGLEAVGRLSLVGKSIEMVGLVPTGLLVNRSAVGIVPPMHDPVTGLLIRMGGGAEVTVPGPLVAADIRWFALSSP